MLERPVSNLQPQEVASICPPDKLVAEQPFCFITQVTIDRRQWCGGRLVKRSGNILSARKRTVKSKILCCGTQEGSVPIKVKQCTTRKGIWQGCLQLMKYSHYQLIQWTLPPPPLFSPVCSSALLQHYLQNVDKTRHLRSSSSVNLGKHASTLFTFFLTFYRPHETLINWEIMDRLINNENNG